MSNIALNKLPQEINVWKRPEIATNGIISNYTAQLGFSHASWPCTYTLDLEKEKEISVIRFLLWDGLGEKGNNRNERKYKFSLSISNDGKNFTTVYSNQNSEGSNGWFSFRFTNEIYARHIRLSGHFNSVNKGFHIVEFEIHDQTPSPLVSNNVSNYEILSGLGSPNEERLSELIDKVVSKKSGLFEGIDEKINTLNKYLQTSREAIDNVELIKQTHGFLEESIKNKNKLKWWLAAAVATLISFISLLYYFVFCDNHSIKIIEDSVNNENTKPFTHILLFAFYITKAIFISTLIFILNWILKNYRSEKHNYVINKHKAMTLTVAIGVLTKEDFSGSDRQNIFNKGMEITFTHQPTGFTKEEAIQPNIINTLMQKESLSTF